MTPEESFQVWSAANADYLAAASQRDQAVAALPGILKAIQDNAAAAAAAAKKKVQDAKNLAFAKYQTMKTAEAAHEAAISAVSPDEPAPGSDGQSI